MRVSQVWESGSGKRAVREALDSEISLKDFRRSESGSQPTDKVEEMVRMKASEFHVQWDNSATNCAYLRLPNTTKKQT